MLLDTRGGEGSRLVHDAFISYSHPDKAIADAVCHRMEAAGIRCWIAPRDVAHGKTWDDAVADAVTAADIVVVIFSASANASRNVLNEVAAALDGGATVIPFRIEDTLPTGALRLHLGRVHWLDALSPPWEPHIDRLIESVTRNLPVPEGREDAGRKRQSELSATSAETGVRADIERRPTDRSGTRYLVAAVIAAILLIAATGVVWRQSSQPATSPQNGEIPKPQSPRAPVVEVPRTLAAHTNSVEVVTISPDGRLLASGGLDNTLRLWTLATGQALSTLSTDTPSSVEGLAFSPDGQLLAAAGDDKTIRLWEPASGKLVRIFTGHAASVYSVAFSPDGRKIASAGSQDNSVRVWSVDDGQDKLVITGNSGNVLCVLFSPDGRLLAAGLTDGSIKLWNAATGQIIQTVVAGDRDINALAFSPDGAILASGSGDHKAKLWNLKGDKPLRVLESHTDSIEAVVFSPNGRLLATGSEDRTIKLWDRASGTLLKTLTGHTGTVNSLAFSPDGATLASGSRDDNIKLWSISQPNQTEPAH